MKFTMTQSGPPPGTYGAEFVGLSDFDGKSDFGPAVVLKFKITSGEAIGQEATRVCGARLSKQSNLAKFAVALKGGPINAGEEIDFASFIGKRGLIVVEPTESGGSRVATFVTAN